MLNPSPKKLNQSYNYSIAQLFAPSLQHKIQKPEEESNIKAFLTYCNLYSDNDEWNLVKGLETAYNYLKYNYRCEYVYKNEIANQLLLKFHNDNSATLLKEVNSDSCVADIVIVNGNTIAYEIKTELDSFERLPNQINSYQALYDYLYIVTHPGAVKSLYDKINSNIGIIILDHDGILKTEREASNNACLFNPTKAALTLRQSELVSAHEKYEGKLPIMGTALIHNFCYQWYLKLSQDKAHIIFAEALKSRKPSCYQFELIKQCPPALKILFLGKEISKKYCSEIINKICIFD